MEKKRLDYLDMAKGIGILLVLMGHLQGDYFFSLSPYIHPFCVFIFAFHMPLFFIISGILIAVKHTDEKSIKELAKNRFKGIMIPYFWFSLFIMVIVIVAFIKGSIQIQSVFVDIWQIISGYGISVLWFLPAIYLGELIFIYLKQKIKSTGKFIAVIVGLFVFALIIGYLMTLPTYDKAIYTRIRELVTVIIRPFVVSGFIAIGYYAHRFCESDNLVARFFSVPKLNDKGNVRILYRAGYLAIGIILMFVCLILSKVNNGIDIRSMVLRNILFFMICALTGSFGLIIFCKGLPRIAPLCYWGQGSLIFMATHNSATVLKYAMTASMYVNQYLTRARGYICYLIVVAIITAYCTIMIFIIQKYLPFIIGKPFKIRKTIH